MTDKIYATLLHAPEEKDVPPDKDIGECYFRDKWGFTIYRTAYGNESERYWKAIVNDLQEQVPAAISERTNGQPDAQAQEILSLFRLDVQSDEQLMDGLTMQQMREYFLQAASNDRDLRPINAFTPPMLGNHLFLLVDEEVVAAAASRQNESQVLWVKCVDADYRAEDHVPRNTRVRQTYFGWMKMATRSLVDFREHLDTWREFKRIAPPMLNAVGRDGFVWDGLDWRDMQMRVRCGLLPTPAPAD